MPRTTSEATMITDRQIADLRRDARLHADPVTAALCCIALGQRDEMSDRERTSLRGGPFARVRAAGARAEVERTIAYAEAERLARVAD